MVKPPDHTTIILAPDSIGREVPVRWNRDCSREMPDAPPTSSWWALETPSDPGPARLRQEAKRRARRRRRRDRWRDRATTAVTCVFLPHPVLGATMEACGLRDVEGLGSSIRGSDVRSGRSRVMVMYVVVGFDFFCVSRCEEDPWA